MVQRKTVLIFINVFIVLLIEFCLKVIKDYKLFIMVAVFLVVDCMILGAWQIFDPPRRETKELQPEVRTLASYNGTSCQCTPRRSGEGVCKTFGQNKERPNMTTFTKVGPMLFFRSWFRADLP